MSAPAKTAPSWFPFAVLGLAAAAAAGPALRATEDVPGISAAVSHPALPALIGNSDAALVRVIVTAGLIDPDKDDFGRYDVSLKSVSFSLAGTDDLADLESLRLVTTGADDGFRPSRDLLIHSHKLTVSPTVPVSDAAAPQRVITLRCDRPLLAGPNVFWLTCRVKASANLLHRLGATCLDIETSGGALTVADDSPGLRQRIGVAVRKGGQDGVDTYGIPCITTTAKGTLLSVYDMRWNYPAHDLQDNITTGLSRSTDGGQTWEPVRTIVSMAHDGGLPPEQNGCSDPGIVTDAQTGETFVFTCWMHGKPGHHQWAGSPEDHWLGNGSAPGFDIGVSPQLLMVRSRDDGQTWSQPENLTRQLKREAWWLLTTAPNHGIQLADGTLVMPMEGRDENGARFATIMTSRDHGAHWTMGTPVSGGSECTVAPLSDGSLMLNMRNHRSTGSYLYRLVFVTRDLGRTWSPHPTNGNTLVEPECNAALLGLDYVRDGQPIHALIFSNPHSSVHNLRIDQTIQVSFDDGRTWPRDHHVLIDEGFAWSYPSITRIDAQRIGIVYTGSQANVVFQALSLDELLRP